MSVYQGMREHTYNLSAREAGKEELEQSKGQEGLRNIKQQNGVDIISNT